MKEQFQDKLYQFQAEPPADAWDRIASSLDAEPNKKYPQKLYNYEQRPPEHIWNQIAEGIDGQNVAPIIPLTQRFGKVFRYGGIAAAVIVFALLTSQLFKKESVSNITGTTDAMHQDPSNQLAQPVEKQSPGEEQEEDEEKEAVQKDQSISNNNRKRWVARKLALLNQQPALAVNNKRINKVISGQYPVVETDRLDRYILFSTSGENPIRLSKKIFSLFACPDNEINCRESITTVQQQVASPTMVASTDFTGMLEMLQNVNNQ